MFKPCTGLEATELNINNTIPEGLQCKAFQMLFSKNTPKVSELKVIMILFPQAILIKRYSLCSFLGVIFSPFTNHKSHFEPFI